MSQLVATATQALKEAICAALNTAMEQGSLPRAELPPCMLEIPADRSHGDWSCNIAMAGARVFRTAPLKIAQAVKAALDLSGTLAMPAAGSWATPSPQFSTPPVIR